MTYEESGVKPVGEAMAALLPWIKKSMTNLLLKGRPVLPIGYYANIIDLGNNQGLAISTDGVGTKVLIAEAMGQYENLGVDLVAMNANDIICVGAMPLAMVDYIACQEAKPEVLLQTGRGLYKGSVLAGITIPGGELAQVPELLAGDGEGIDLVGTCIGTVPLDRIICGVNVEPGDVVIGVESSGIHSNGLTLARHVLLNHGGWNLHGPVPSLGCTLGQELLKATRIYVGMVRELLERLEPNLHVKALYHITGDGLLNLSRIPVTVGVELDYLPDPHRIFHLIQGTGSISDAEMYSVFNMGVGFVMVVRSDVVEQAHIAAGINGFRSWRIGTVVENPQKQVWLVKQNLISRDGKFTPV